MATKAEFERDEVWVIPLLEAEIAKLPFPDTARALGGLLVVDSPVDQLKIEKFRAAWRKTVKEAKPWESSSS